MFLKPAEPGVHLRLGGSNARGSVYQTPTIRRCRTRLNTWMKKYYPPGNVVDGLNVGAYSVAQTLVAVLKACGDNLTRENVMKQAASIHDLKLPMMQVPTLAPGIIISTSADDYAPIKQMRLAKFDGAKWVPFGELISAPGN